MARITKAYAARYRLAEESDGTQMVGAAAEFRAASIVSRAPVALARDGSPCEREMTGVPSPSRLAPRAARRAHQRSPSRREPRADAPPIGSIRPARSPEDRSS